MPFAIPRAQGTWLLPRDISAQAKAVAKSLATSAKSKDHANKTYPKQLNITASYKSSRAKSRRTTKAVL